LTIAPELDLLHYLFLAGGDVDDVGIPLYFPKICSDYIQKNIREKYDQYQYKSHINENNWESAGLITAIWCGVKDLSDSTTRVRKKKNRWTTIKESYENYRKSPSSGVDISLLEFLKDDICQLACKSHKEGLLNRRKETTREDYNVIVDGKRHNVPSAEVTLDDKDRHERHCRDLENLQMRLFPLILQLPDNKKRLLLICIIGGIISHNFFCKSGMVVSSDYWEKLEKATKKFQDFLTQLSLDVKTSEALVLQCKEFEKMVSEMKKQNKTFKSSNPSVEYLRTCERFWEICREQQSLLPSPDELRAVFNPSIRDLMKKLRQDGIIYVWNNQHEGFEKKLRQLTPEEFFCLATNDSRYGYFLLCTQCKNEIEPDNCDSCVEVGPMKIWKTFKPKDKLEEVFIRAPDRLNSIECQKKSSKRS